jgi:hypothetical protein
VKNDRKMMAGTHAQSRFWDLLDEVADVGELVDEDVRGDPAEKQQQQSAG